MNKIAKLKSRFLGLEPVNSKKLFIHAGNFKTGTSFFQHVMYHNRDALKRLGLLYPEQGLGLDTNHNRYAHRLLGLDIANGSKNRFHEIRESLLASPDLDAAFVSYEGFCHQATLKKLKADKACFKDLDVQALLVFRPHIDHAISLYRELCQNVGLRFSFKNLMTPKRSMKGMKYWRKTMDYRRIVRAWSAIAGPESLHLMPYRTIQNDLSAHLFATTGLKAQLVLPDNTNRNHTLSAPSAELMRRINNKLGLPAAARLEIARTLSDLDIKTPQLSEYCELTPRQAHLFEKEFKADRAYLKKRGFDPVADLSVADNWKWGHKTNMRDAIIHMHERLSHSLQDEQLEELGNAVRAMKL